MSAVESGDLYVAGTITAGVIVLPDSTVRTAGIAANQVTASKLTTTLQTGYVPLSLASAREISSNATINAAGIGGLLASDTTPIFERVNGATDTQLRLTWAASNVDEITWSFVLPPDLDDTVAITVKLLAAMESTNDTPVIAVKYFEGVGDTNAGGNTAAVTGTSVATYSVTIAAGDVGAAPKPVSISLVPGTHGTDKLYLYGAWIEYTRK